MGGQFPPEWWWSGCSGIQPESALFTSGQFAPESSGQFDRILHLTQQLQGLTAHVIPAKSQLQKESRLSIGRMEVMQHISNVMKLITIIQCL